MFKSKEKQREANKEHAKAYRKRKGMTQGMTIQGITEKLEKLVAQSDTNRVKHHLACKCMLCRPSKYTDA